MRKSLCTYLMPVLLSTSAPLTLSDSATTVTEFHDVWQRIESDRKRQPTENEVSNKYVSRVQCTMIRIVDVLDRLALTGNSGYPDSRESSGTSIIRKLATNNGIPELAERVSYSYAWPWALLCVQSATEGDFVSQMRRNSSFFDDPFSARKSLMYYSSNSESPPTDYVLISVGPDETADLAPYINQSITSSSKSADRFSRWLQWRSSLSVDVFQAQTPSDSELVDFLTWNNKVYDPTNGSISSGDIVFQRQYGRDSLFDFDASFFPLTSATVTAIPIRRYEKGNLHD